MVHDRRAPLSKKRTDPEVQGRGMKHHTSTGFVSEPGRDRERAAWKAHTPSLDRPSNSFLKTPNPTANCVPMVQGEVSHRYLIDTPVRSLGAGQRVIAHQPQVPDSTPGRESTGGLCGMDTRVRNSLLLVGTRLGPCASSTSRQRTSSRTGARACSCGAAKGAHGNVTPRCGSVALRDDALSIQSSGDAYIGVRVVTDRQRDDTDTLAG